MYILLLTTHYFDRIRVKTKGACGNTLVRFA